MRLPRELFIETEIEDVRSRIVRDRNRKRSVRHRSEIRRTVVHLLCLSVGAILPSILLKFVARELATANVYSFSSPTASILKTGTFCSTISRPVQPPARKEATSVHSKG